MVSISVSARSLAAARTIDPDVSTAAVRAAVETALEADRREARREEAAAAAARPARAAH